MTSLRILRPATSRPFPVSSVTFPRQRRPWTSIAREKDSLKIDALERTSFPYIWLRDACQAPTSVHPSTRQKLFRSSDIPLDIQPVPTQDSVRVTLDGIEISWTDGTMSIYDRVFLQEHANWEKVLETHREHELKEEAWTRSSVSSTPSLFVSYASLPTPRGLVEAITQLAKYGLLFVQGVPNEKTSGDECELKPLAERFGEIRRTFYGETWDVVNLQGQSRNIAYTNLALGLHMDLLYFQHPPRYQILHCLRSRVVGGTSIFVDALHAANVLHSTSPADFDVLTKTPVAFHYINDGHHLHREHPTIELAPEAMSSVAPTNPTPGTGTAGPQIKHINYSPPFQAPLPINTPSSFYPALQKFASLLNDPEHAYEYTLKEGDAVIFDNRRVLHARTAFHEPEGTEGVIENKAGEANRWLKGCYLEADAVLDRVRVLKTKIERGLV